MAWRICIENVVARATFGSGNWEEEEFAKSNDDYKRVSKSFSPKRNLKYLHGFFGILHGSVGSVVQLVPVSVDDDGHKKAAGTAIKAAGTAIKAS